MEALSKEYSDYIGQLVQAIQESELLEAYLDTEEDEYYKQLQDAYEPVIHGLYEQVADHNPLQLESLELELLNPELEGLYLPKILGYSIMRGEVDESYRYRRPQDHFKKVLLAICNSANFDHLRKRIGQSIKVGFAISSDIWVTHLIESVDNKKVKSYLNTLRGEQFIDIKKRKLIYENYKMQFSSANFQSTDFPKTEYELKSSFHSIRSFLLYRAEHKLDNESILRYITLLLENDHLAGSEEYFELLMISGLMYKLDDAQAKVFAKTMAQIEKESVDFQFTFFNIFDRLHKDERVTVMPEHENNLGNLVASLKSKDIKAHFTTLEVLHSRGVVHADAIENIRNYYESHQGMSMQNECLRFSVLGYFKRLLPNLEPDLYTDYFEFVKIMTLYIEIFSNEKFNQALKELNLEFVNSCISHFTDKRSKDYQDIRKFVSSTFKDLGFLKDKEITELFKTKRSRKKAE
jgi:hypothetical protein